MVPRLHIPSMAQVQPRQHAGVLGRMIALAPRLRWSRAAGRIRTAGFAR